MHSKYLVLAVIVLYASIGIVASTQKIISDPNTNLNEVNLESNIKKMYTDSCILEQNGTWAPGTYGDYMLEPPGTGNYYLYANSTIGDEASYFTQSLDLSGLTMAHLSYSYSFAGTGVAGIVSYSGGIDIDNYEERFVFLNEWNNPEASTEIILFNPSSYNVPSEVYIEFYHFNSYGTDDPPGFAIDNIEIAEIGYFEGFEIFNGSLSGYVTDPSMNPLEGARVQVCSHGTYEEDYTNSTGFYQVTNIPICYCLKNATASKTGYTTEWILLSIVENTTHDFILAPLYDVYVDDDYTSSTPGWGYDHFDFIQDGIDAVSESGTVYVYNGTYYDNVIINKTIDLIGEEKNNTIVDGNNNGYVLNICVDWVNISNFTIQNSNDFGMGIFISNNSNYTKVSYCNIIDNYFGIEMSKTSYTIIQQNLIENNEYGIQMEYYENYSTIDNIICNNIIRNNYGGAGIISPSENLSVKNNSVYSNTLGIALGGIKNSSVIGNNISNNYPDYGLYIGGSSHNNIQGNHLIDNGACSIDIYNSFENIIKHNNVSQSYIGIKMVSSNNNTINSNTIFNTTSTGFYISDCLYNTFSDNVINMSEDGIYVTCSYSNSYDNNHIINHNDSGICLGWYSFNNTIKNNQIYSNNNGLKIYEYSYNNTIFHNDFINNIQNAFDESNSIWYNPTIQEGNYWDDYYGNDTDGDGIGDMPYDIPGGNNQDLYPLCISNQPPIADFTYTPILPNQGETIQFNSTAIDYDGTIVNYTWYFGYHIIYGKNPTYQFNDSGMYLISLEVKDDDDGSDTVAKMIPVSFDMMYITNTSIGWNLISTPYNQQLDSYEFLYKYDGYYYDWALATMDYNPTNSPLVNSYMFDWNRTQQTYAFESNLDPGYGCWMYAYQPVEIWVQADTAQVDDNITNLEKGWNIVGLPHDQPIDKTDILVDDVPWISAVSNGWVSDFVFSWNRSGQCYNFAETFIPAYAYWMYTYQSCTLKRSI